jgi:hypothetical protein
LKRDARPLVIEMYKAIEKAEGRGSVDRARAAARAAGATFSNAQSMVWLKPFIEAAAVRLQSERRKNGVENKHETADIRRDDQPAVGLARDKVIPKTSNSSSLRSDGPPELFESSTASNGAKPARRKPKAAPDTAWVEPLLVEARKLKPVAIRDLSADTGRRIFSRYHAFTFGGCTKNEHTNKLRALDVAKGLARMSRSEVYGGMTCGEFVGYAQKVHAERNSKPWFDVFLVIAYCEFEQSRKAGAA